MTAFRRDRIDGTEIGTTPGTTLDRMVAPKKIRPPSPVLPQKPEKSPSHE